MRQSQVKAGRDSAAPIPAPVAEFRMIQQKYRQEQREERPIMDRKQRQEIAEKKQALGLRD